MSWHKFYDFMKRTDWKESAEKFWEDIKERAYYIIGITTLILLPLILGAPGMPDLPIISDIYSLGRDTGLFSSNTYVLRILTIAAIFAIFAASWDLLSGYTGQFSFGHALFLGFSAYVAYWVAVGVSVTDTIITIDADKVNIINNVIPFIPSGEVESFVINIPTGSLNMILGSKFILDPYTAILFGALITTIVAAGIGIVALRLKGSYLALVTLMLPIIAIQLITIFDDITGGDFGIPGIPLLVNWTGLNRPNEQDRLNLYILTTIVLFISVGIMMLIAYSRLGLILQSIREDEEAAESLGINLTLYKIFAFMVSAFFAGIAGGMYAQLDRFAGPSFFDTKISFMVIIMVIIGGVGSIIGGVVGAFMLTILVDLFLNQVFAEVPEMEILAFGALLVITLRYIPFGLTRAKSDQKRAIVIGILFAIFWVISIPLLQDLDKFNTLANENIFTFVSIIIMILIILPAIPVFFITEFIGLILLNDIIGLELADKALIKAKFVLAIVIGIPFAYYFPKLFKKVRLRYWGIWPSVGQYEPD
ncbi:MAG: branched-chain amino acid ABC transporter permease [Candidatus Hodarchaeales archaeon]|jgi:branched-chain amino acid transport system permease protein